MLLCLKFARLARDGINPELLLIGIPKRRIIGCEERTHEKE
jgi:hypothetical protein